MWGPVGYGVGAAAGSLASSAFSKKGVNFRGKYARNQLKHDKKVWAAQEAQRRKNEIWQTGQNRENDLWQTAQISPRQAALMKSMDESGLHRLAALGITPGAGTSMPSPQQGPVGHSSQPIIPGQSNFGSAVETGINTALNVAQDNRMYGLKMQEQELRNDWLRTQIANSRIKTVAALANSQQDLTGKPGPGPTQPGTLQLNEHTSLPTGITTGSQDAEDRYWEFGGAAQGLLNIGYDLTGWLFPGFGKDYINAESKVRQKQANDKTSKVAIWKSGRASPHWQKYRPPYPTRTRSSGKNPRYK